MSEKIVTSDLQPAADEQPVDLLGTEDAEPEYVPATEQKNDGAQEVSRKMRIEASMHSGPLPPPSILAAYEQVLPGLAERIVHRFEIQSDHRMKLESQVIASDAFSQKVGTVAGSLLGILAIGGGVLLSYIGKDAAGIGTIVVAVGGLVAAFGIGKRSHDRQLEKQQSEAKRLPSGSGEEN